MQRAEESNFLPCAVFQNEIEKQAWLQKIISVLVFIGDCPNSCSCS